MLNWKYPASSLWIHCELWITQFVFVVEIFPNIKDELIIFRSFRSNFLKDSRQKWQNVVDFFIFSIIDKRRMHSSMNFIPRYFQNHDDDDEDTRAISTIWKTQIFV